jgi:hypothetical protein
MAGATAMAIISSIAQMVRRSMDQVTGSGNGIEATRMKRVTAGKAAGRQPGAPQNAMSGNRLQGILRARGSEPAAGGQQGRQQQLIASNQGPGSGARDQQKPHYSSRAGEKTVAPGTQFSFEILETCLIGLAASANDQITGGLMTLDVAAPDFPQPSAQTIPGHRG